MSPNPTINITVPCPCCGASLTIDPQLRKVVAHETPPQKHHDAPDLDHAGDVLRQQKLRREALFKQSTEDEMSKAQLLERKFEEALKKSKDEPVTRPQRDIDL